MPKTSKYKEDLIPRIRDLIDGYSSASILKEYLQNADDSGATELIVTFDKQNYQELKGTKYEAGMGASLLLFNNSIFRDKDFESIVQISAQGKSSDAGSTGRFGQGFSSSFSISDHPSFLSNNRIYWFDVLKTAISKDEYDDILYWEDTEFNEISDWLKTFQVAGFDYSKPYHSTIFRLPLRRDNNDSKISNEVFTFDSFLLWVEELKYKAENLLFLRNIHTLTLQEIDEDGNKIIHLEIKTNNSEEIQNINNSIQTEFGDDGLIDICNRWKSSETDLPLFLYHHNFSISYWNIEEKQKEKRDETWAVVNGLFRGENNCLIDNAMDVLQITPNPRKVLPWAGVALCLDENKKPIKKDSQWYTFLPLPIESDYPIQLHGWFDLNPKRTEITHDGTGDDKETLISWNQQLLEHGVGVAWALLIDYIKDEKYLNSYYSFWAKQESNALDKYLIKGFYNKITKLKCFHIIYKNEKKWMYPTDNIYFFEDREDTLLSHAFKEHFQIINPKPPKTIIQNFEEIENITLNEITPLFIRNYLEEVSKEISSFPITLTDISISMLSTKNWFLEVVKYCADKGENYNLIRNLPLELTLDGKIYKVGVNTLVDENPNLELFQDREYLFLDKELTDVVKHSTTLPNSWLEPTLKNKIVILLEYWEKLDLNKEWISELVQLIDSDRDELNRALDNIKQLPIVYQQNKEFVCLESDIAKYPAIMIRDEDKDNTKYFETIGMNIIHIDYMEIYKPLLRWTNTSIGKKTFITELSSETLAKHLLLLNNFDFFKDRDTREFIIDVLAEDTSWFDNLRYYYNDKNKFLSMPFIETVGGNLYSISSEKKLFLPTGFNSPSNIKGLQGEYELVKVTIDSNLFEMYKKMGIKEQTAESYIKEIIIPFLKNSDSIEEKRDVLKWLAMELENITKGSDNELINILKKSNIIPTQLNENILTTSSNLYHPRLNLPPILKNKEFMPIVFKDDTIQEKWIYFLERIGISKSILSTHIITIVKKIVEDNNQEDAILLLNYIANNFEIFEQMDILDTLKEYAWFPVEKPYDILKPKSEYTELKRVYELILVNDIKIAGGYYHILNKRVKLGKKDEKGEIRAYDMARKLGIVTTIQNEHFFKSFRELIKLSPTNGKVVNYTKEIYKYIGRRFKGESVDFDIEERTILIDNQWITPKYVYQYQINLTGIYSWSNLVGNETESDLAKGLILLGVQAKPTFDFFIEQLQKLPKEQDLKPNQLRDAKALLHEIQNKDENSIYDELPILTGNNQLVLSSNLYINDLPAYKNANDKNRNLKFCQGQFERLAKRLDILALSKNYTSEIYDYEKCESSHKVVNIMKNDSFKEGILRLLFHEKKIREDEINECILHGVLPSSLIFVNQLVIEYSIENNFLFRSNESAYEEEGNLYILEQDDEDDMIEVISKYICDKKDLSRDSFGWIERILRKQMNIEKIHNFLDKKKIIELPQKFEIEDDVAIFEDYPSKESNKEVTYDTSTNQEDYVEASSEHKGKIAPTIKPKTSSENTNNHTSNKSDKKIVSSNDRKPVYVGKDREVNEEQRKSQRESAKEIGDKGENYILANEKTLLILKTNYFEKAPTNNKGFDIYEKDASGQTIRYIEVKTLTGQWGQGGVGITEHQLDFAQKLKDKWWLFVVENINTDNTKIYQFKNPILEANSFMFDGSWKQLAYKKI